MAIISEEEFNRVPDTMTKKLLSYIPTIILWSIIVPLIYFIGVKMVEDNRITNSKNIAKVEALIEEFKDSKVIGVYSYITADKFRTEHTQVVIENPVGKRMTLAITNGKSPIVGDRWSLTYDPYYAKRNPYDCIRLDKRIK